MSLQGAARHRFSTGICTCGTTKYASEAGHKMPHMPSNRLPFDAPGVEGEFSRIEVRRSTRRKKTISAEIVGDALEIGRAHV